MGAVLLVDDDPSIRESLAELLEDEGYDVVTASDGREALDVLGTLSAPCIILLDLMMPGMNGWDFLSAIACTRHAGVPVLVMSAASPSQFPLHQDVIPKPIKLDRMLATVAEHCTNRQPHGA